MHRSSCYWLTEGGYMILCVEWRTSTPNDLSLSVIILYLPTYEYGIHLPYILAILNPTKESSSHGFPTSPYLPLSLNDSSETL